MLDGWIFFVCREMILISREKGDDEPMSASLGPVPVRGDHGNDDERAMTTQKMRATFIF
jgi:hypothetical protein